MEGSTIEIEISEDLKRRLDEIAKKHGVTRKEWVKETLARVIRSESARNKIMKAVSDEYLEGKINFAEMVELIGFEDAEKIKAVVEGARMSIREADVIAKA